MANGQDFNVFGGSQNVAAQAQKQFISNLFRQPPSSGVGSFSAIERRLSMYASSEDTRVIAGVEKVLEKIVSGKGDSTKLEAKLDKINEKANNIKKEAKSKPKDEK